jgi:hypothetical protein
MEILQGLIILYPQPCDNCGKKKLYLSLTKITTVINQPTQTKPVINQKVTNSAN